MPATPSLSEFRFFAAVPPKTLEAISAASSVLNFSARHVIFRPDEPADTLFCLVEGEVELSLEVHDKSLKADVRHEESVHAQVVDHIREIADV